MNGRLARRLRKLGYEFHIAPENQKARRPWSSRELYRALKYGYKYIRRTGAKVRTINPYYILAVFHHTRPRKRKRGRSS